MPQITVSSSGFSQQLKLLLPQHQKAPTGKIVLLDMPQQSHLQVITQVMNVLIKDEGSSGVYMTTMKGYPELSNIFTQNGLDLSKIYFVDVISKMYGLEPKETPNCEYISSPINIQSISNAITTFLGKIKGNKKFLVFDSLTTILLYNSLPRIVEFTTTLSEYLKSQHVEGILVMLSTAKGSTNDKLLNALGAVIDDTISIRG